jgi:site-specific DNA-methyltransferase (adenine-specific)
VAKTIFVENCLDTMARMSDESIDLVVTSPPYDNLRTYNGYSFNFEAVASELWRVIKTGGVVVWVVGDATINGSETGTSFRQALFFKEVGFNLHDTMIWEKAGRIPTQDRYYNIFEYMFVFSKGKPKSMNFIVDNKNVNPVTKRQKDQNINKGNKKKASGFFETKEFSRRPNIWRIVNKGNSTKHPAVFPENLALDHITTWSEVGDIVYDPFMGSGTTAIAAEQLNRNWIGSEISSEYAQKALERLNRG